MTGASAIRIVFKAKKCNAREKSAQKPVICFYCSYLIWPVTLFNNSEEDKLPVLHLVDLLPIRGQD